jgi:hypothetical protein
MISWLHRDVRRYTFSDAIASYARIQGVMLHRDPSTLQKVGMALRATTPSVWVDCVYWAMVDHQPPIAVIAGVRFPEEADMIRAVGGKILRVERFNRDGTVYVKGDRDENHPAEGGLQYVAPDEIVRNDQDALVSLMTSVERKVGPWLI